LNPIKIVLWVKIAITFWSFNFEILKVILWMPSSSMTTFLFIKAVTRERVFDVNRVNIIISLIRVLWFRFSYLLSDLSYLLLKLNRGLIYLIGLLKRNVLGVQTIFFLKHGLNGLKLKRTEKEWKQGEHGSASGGTNKKIVKRRWHNYAQRNGVPVLILWKTTGSVG